MNFSTVDFSINDRKKLMFSHFEHFEGKQSDFTLEQLYDFLDKKVFFFKIFQKITYFNISSSESILIET